MILHRISLAIAAMALAAVPAAATDPPLYDDELVHVEQIGQVAVMPSDVEPTPIEVVPRLCNFSVEAELIQSVLKVAPPRPYEEVGWLIV